jgi:metal-responsive CopG/Arc/MetJ family transcriptional regulator
MALLHINIDENLKAEIDSCCKDFHYANTTEFVRDSLRKNIEAYKRLKTMQQTVMSKPFTKKERTQNAIEFAKINGWNVPE